MIIAPCKHLQDNLLMHPVQSPKFALPPFCLRMIRIPFLSLCQDIPQGVEFIMLTTQVITAQFIRRYVPYSHIFYNTTVGKIFINDNQIKEWGRLLNLSTDCRQTLFTGELARHYRPMKSFKRLQWGVYGSGSEVSGGSYDIS